MLRIQDLSVSYGAIQALRSVSMEVGQGQIVAIIGANGAGKSTLLNAVSAVVPVTGGEVLLDGKPLPRAAHQVVAAGVVQIPEGRRVFANLTVEDNLRVGGYLETDRAAVAERTAEAYRLFPILGQRRRQYAGTLSGGEQQMLALGRGMMSSPKVLLIDEPSLGLAPLIIKEVFAHIRRINEQGTTVLLVEQNAGKALAVADYAYVLETGRIVGQGSGRELLADPIVQQAYLGAREAAPRA